MSIRQFAFQVRLLMMVLSIRTRRAAQLDSIRSRWGHGRPRQHQFADIAASHASRVALSRADRSLDNRTWNDLHLDDVFVALDHTTSTLGQHALYHRLRRLSAGGDDLSEFEALTSFVTDNRAAREGAQLAVAHLQDPHGYNLWWLAHSDAAAPRRWYAIFPLLSVTAALALIVAPYWPWALVLLLINVGVRYATDEHISAVAGCFRQFAPLISSAESIAGMRLPPGSPAPLKQLQTDVPGLAPLKLISRWTSGNPLMLSLDASRWAVAAGDFVNAIYEYVNLSLLLDATGVFVGANVLRQRQPALLRVVATVGELDAATGVASYRASRTDWTRPRFLPANSPATLEDLGHPLVRNAVPNSIAMDPGRGVLVTGSNMAGKSTFLRTVGVNAVLAQTVNTCIGGRYEAPFLTVRSCIGRADNLLAGKSYYIIEVEALVDLIAASMSDANHLFLLDEVFHGTNTVERIAAAHAVLEELIGETTAPKAHYVVAATHDRELHDLLGGFESFHFRDEVGPEGLQFDFTLRRGVATSRTAIELLRRQGAPAATVEKAMRTAARLDEERNRA